MNEFWVCWIKKREKRASRMEQTKVHHINSISTSLMICCWKGFNTFSLTEIRNIDLHAGFA